MSVDISPALWTVQSLKRCHEENITSVDWDANGQYLLSGGENGSISIQQIKGPTPPNIIASYNLSHKDEITESMRFVQYEQTPSIVVATSAYDHSQLRTYSLSGRDDEHVWSTALPCRTHSVFTHHGHHSTIFHCGSDGNIRWYDPRAESPVAIVKTPENSVSGTAFSAADIDGSSRGTLGAFAPFSRDGTIYIANLLMRDITKVFKIGNAFRPANSLIQSVKFTPDASALVVATDNHQLLIVCVETGTVLASLRAKGLEDYANVIEITSLTVGGNGKGHCIWADITNETHYWDLNTILGDDLEIVRDRVAKLGLIDIRPKKTWSSASAAYVKLAMNPSLRMLAVGAGGSVAIYAP